MIRIKQNYAGGIIWGLLAGIIILWMAACGTETSAPEETSSGDKQSLSVPERIIGIGRIEPKGKILDLYTEIPGIVTDIAFQPGDEIEAGETILFLSREMEEARLAQAEARIASQKSKIKSVQAALAGAKIRLEDAARTLSRTETLLKNEAEAQAAYDRAKTAHDALTQEVRQLEAEVDVSRNMLNQYRTDLGPAQVELDRKSLAARSDGRLLTLDVTIGSLVVPERPFGTFAVDGPVIARVEVDELFAGMVHTGQKAAVRELGETEPIAEGEVIFAGPALRKKSLFSDNIDDLVDRRVREVWIGLPETESLMLGMRVECVIKLDGT